MSFLENGDHRRALEHFREALRINPNLDHAQRGLLEALRCRFIAYRAGRFVRNWFNKPQNREYNLLTGPLSLAVSIVLAPLLVVTLIYWPFLTSLPRFDRLGRQVLTRDQIIESNITCSLTLLVIACFVGFFLTHEIQLIYSACSLFGACILTTVAFRSHEGWPRRIAISIVVLFALNSIVAQIYLFRQEHPPTAFMATPSENSVGDCLSIEFILFLLLLGISSGLSKR